MKRFWMHRLGLSAVWLGFVAGLSTAPGCAVERAPIDKTQAGVLDKSFFLGPDIEDFRDDPEFRTKSYNIDSPANADNPSATIGGSSAVDRIRWEVTEKMLLARRSYQESPGADGRGLPRVEVSPGRYEFQDRPTGTIVAAYRIDSHFDVRRDYNPTTGEEVNVIVENTSDRPWNQRRYMRVDWSQNLALSTNDGPAWLFGQGADATAIQYAVTSESDPDRPHFETDNGYFDITNKYQVRPRDLPGIGVPECVLMGFFTGTSSFDCSPTEVKVRLSFVKLSGAEDFEPFEESMASRDIIGNWGNASNSYEREYGAAPITAWDPQYGYTDAKTKTFYALHNIWEKSHLDAACSSNSDSDANGTADECEPGALGYDGSRGSQCDVHVGKCTIPVRDRTVKTIGYWLNADAPVELTDQVGDDGVTVRARGPIEEMTVTWNQLMRVSVAMRREVECRRTKDGTRDECHAQFFEGQGPSAKEMVAFGGWGIDRAKDWPTDRGRPVIATCHNPVRAYDPEVCGKPGDVSRLGDVRKNHLIYWPHASRAPYGGVATVGADPLTGEMVGASATIMGRSVTHAAAHQRDIIQLAIGDVTVDSLIEGGQAERYAAMVQSGRVHGALSRAKSPEELKAAHTMLDHSAIRASARADVLGLDGLSAEERSLKRALLRSEDSLLTPRVAADDARVSSLMGKLTGSEFASDVQNRGLLQLVASSRDKSTSLYRSLQTFAATDPSQLQDVFDKYQAYLGQRGVCFHDSAQSAGAGSIHQPSLAPYFKKKYAGLSVTERGVKIYEELLSEAVKGIGFHELGHSIGMRHNFASSWDAENFSPQYWQLRTNEGKSTATCRGPRSGAEDTCMGPRYLDPLTDDEQGLLPDEPRPSIDYFGNTSAMEYQIERFGETVGAGTYDLHTMKTLYGRVLETMDARSVPAESQPYFAVKTLSQGIPSDLVYVPNAGYGAHYTKAATLAKVFDPVRDCRPATDEELASAKWRIVHGKVCSPPPKNHLAYEDMKSTEIAFTLKGKTVPIGVSGVRWSGVDETGAKLVRWHYRYGEDYSRGGYVHAKMFDSGADIYEATLNVAKRFDLLYPWQYFRRLNKEFAWWSLPSAVAGSTFSRLRAYHWNTTTDIGRASPPDLEDDDRERPAVMASAEMWNFLQRVILMPEPGVYGKGEGTDKRTPTRRGALTILDVMSDSEAATTKNVFGSIGIGDGRYVQIDFDNARGGSWDYQRFPKHVGFDEEKVLALRELVDSRPTLSTVSRENALDGRDPYISFRTDRPHAVDRLVGGILSEDWETIAPSLLSDGRTLQNMSILDPDPALSSRPSGAKAIFPNLGYQNQLGTGIYALLFSRFSGDMGLATKMRIRLDGDSGPTIPESRAIAFTDPVTGQRYVALRFGTETISGRPVELGVASRMIARANELLADAYAVKRDDSGLPVLGPTGEPELVLSAGMPTSRGAVEEATLRRYIALLDAVRQVGNLFGGGPLGGGQGGGGD